MKPRERTLALTLVVVASLVAAYVGAMQVIGARMGDPCRDSYNCQGFLLQGVECVDSGKRSYCTRYCKTNLDCPKDWRCAEANPTALTIETTAIGKVCVQD